MLAREDSREFFMTIAKLLKAAKVVVKYEDTLAKGHDAHLKGRNDEALRAYSGANYLFSTIDDIRGKGRALLGMTDLEIRIGKYREARTFIEEAKSLFEKAGAIILV